MTQGPEEDLANVMHWMYLRGLVQLRGGNASVVDRREGVVYITPTGTPRPLITRDSIAVISLEDGSSIRGSPSSEWRMHVAIYKAIEEARAIVHAHPPYSIAADLVNLKLDTSTLLEASYTIKCIARIPKATPGTWELARKVAETLEKTGCNAAILKGHGTVAYSTHSIYHALDTLEALEDLAKITLATNKGTND
jgi:L-fuculose-phosphate aldolase